LCQHRLLKKQQPPPLGGVAKGQDV